MKIQSLSLCRTAAVMLVLAAIAAACAQPSRREPSALVPGDEASGEARPGDAQEMPPLEDRGDEAMNEESSGRANAAAVARRQSQAAAQELAAAPAAALPQAKIEHDATAERADALRTAPRDRTAMEAGQPFAPEPPAWAPYASAGNTERYQHLDDNPIRIVADDPVSTFSLDVDTGSYSNVRRFLAGGSRPPQDAVRVEELVNYFPYDAPRIGGRDPFGIRTELVPCPWKPQHWLLRVAVRADEVDAKAMPPANLVFLVDVSGSMDEPAKLPLLRQSLKLLAGQLRAEDRLSLVVYAGSTGVVLEPTPGDQHERIARAIDGLVAGGSTAGEAGIRLAYRMARQSFIDGGINRVLLATDGDFNVGITDFEQVKDLVEHERESGVQLSTLGFGAGNLNEQLMEQLADTGNGSYAYIDNLNEGRKVLVDQVRSTLVTVAKDVKVQVEFNPAAVSEYRLIGYENRALAREDFANDRVDAGDVGAGQSVTALYELTPAGAAASVDPLRYAPKARGDESARCAAVVPGASASEIAFVKLRYKQPSGGASRLVELAVTRSALVAPFDAAGDDVRFATAVAAFGQILRGARHTGSWTLDDVLRIAEASRGRDEFGYRSEFVSLVRLAKTLG